MVKLIDLPSLVRVTRSQEDFGPNDANFIFYNNVILENIPLLRLSNINLRRPGISFGNVQSIQASHASALERYIRVACQNDGKNYL